MSNTAAVGEKVGTRGHDKGHQEGAGGEHKNLHVFVNNRKFGEEDGVRSVMTGRQVAALVGVPAENAEITRERDGKQITADETVNLEHTEHFQVIRARVDGGCCHVA